MARYNEFNSLEEHEYRTLMDPSYVFIAWLIGSEDGPEYAYSSTLFAAKVRHGRAPEANCLLDYLFVWLAEGRATLFSPTYEDWLFTIITIADQLRRGRFGFRYTERNGDGFGDTEERHYFDYTLEELRRCNDELKIDAQLPILSAELDLQHPALDRILFERRAAKLKADAASK